MPAPAEPHRRYTVALVAAAAATTVAVGVTAATLLGWFRPSEPRTTPPAATAEPAVVYVPIAPADSPNERVAIELSHDRDDGEHEHEQDDDDD